MSVIIRGLSGGYGDTLIHRDISLQIGAGEVLAVVGRNGTGKTTLARLIGGGLAAAGGSLALDGVPLARLADWARARAGVVVMPQTGMVFDGLTVGENLALTGADPAQIAAMTERFPRLAERLSQRAGSMSGGERKILGFARALLRPGKLLVLDEPSEGVQPENIAIMTALIAERQRAGTAVLLLEQNLSMILEVADRVMALDVGGIMFTLEAEQISREAVLAALKI